MILLQEVVETILWAPFQSHFSGVYVHVEVGTVNQNISRVQLRFNETSCLIVSPYLQSFGCRPSEEPPLPGIRVSGPRSEKVHGYHQEAAAHYVDQGTWKSWRNLTYFLWLPDSTVE